MVRQRGISSPQTVAEYLTIYFKKKERKERKPGAVGAADGGGADEGRTVDETQL